MISSGCNIQSRPTPILWISGEKERFVADTVTVNLGNPVPANEYMNVEGSVNGGETSVFQNNPAAAFEDANVYQSSSETTTVTQGNPTPANEYMIVEQSVTGDGLTTVAQGDPVAANEDMYVRVTVQADADALGSVLQGDPVADHLDP
jgi:hypothetical protein